MMIRGLKAILTIAAIALAAAPASASALEFVPGGATVQALTANGRALSQAAGHPASFNFSFELKTNSEGFTEGGQARAIVVGFPLGFYGNPLAVPRCTRADFDGKAARCPLETQIGVVRAITPLSEIHVPLFNLEPAPGVAAEFGTNGLGLEALQFATVRSEVGPAGEPAYQLVVSSPNLPIELIKVSVTIWGVPSESSHDAERGEDALEGGEPKPSNAPPLSFLTLPSSCDTPPVTSISVEPTLAPGSLVTEQAPFFDTAGNVIALSGCESVPFSPKIVSAPTIGQAEGSSGLHFQLSLPNQGLTEPGSIAEAQPEKTEVVLPQGITVNPSAANGIAGCSEIQFRAANGEPGQGCPEASKIGTLTAKSPLLEELIEGSVYLAQPHANKFDSLLALYIVAKAPERGVLVKAPGVATADPVTGQLTATFDELPPLPYSSFEVNLREGPRAPLITPQTCGTYETVARLYPYSAPTVATVRTAPFKITSGANGGACASSEAALPAHPAFEAGTANPLAGAYSPFVFRVKRSDGEQRVSSVSATLPLGLVGSIAGVPYCPESGIATAAARGYEGGGAAEIVSPSCPAASQVGIVNVSAGAGSEPFFVQGKVYLAGPYKGAPLSVEIITPAIAGPFDLGSVAVRTALYVNESTAQIHAVSDPLPTILHGIPLGVRTISLQMNRPNFMLNPTNCQAKTVTGSVTTLVGGVANLSAPFAANGCKGLAFQPNLKLSFTGQTKRTGFPAVKAVLTQPKGQNANLSGASVILPKGMLIANAHINNPCTRVQFNSTATPGEGCPAKSVLGTAKVWTPLLDQPETGKVYFRSNGGERELPDIVVALRGQVPLQLVGFIDSVHKKGSEVSRVRTRFQNVPDAPQCAAPYSPSFCKKIGKSLKFKFEKSSAVSSPPRTASKDLVSYDRSAASASGASLKGSTKRGGHPALRAVLKMKPGEANIAKISVALPHSEFLAQSHIKTVCTRVQFAAGAGNGAECPKGSIYGFARAKTPLLDNPLEGPVYLRSSSNPLPDLVVALHGQIDVDLDGRIDSKNGGIRTTFDTVPDAPVSEFILSMEGGKKGLIENSTDICQGTHKAQVKATAQNGKLSETAPALQPECGKKAKKKGSKKGKGGKKS